MQLWSSGLVAVLGASASTSGTSYTPYAKIYDAGSHQLVSDIAGEWCAPEGSCGSTIGTFPAGDTVTLGIGYDRKIGFLGFSAFDLTTGTAFVAGYKPGTGVSFTQARVGTEFGSDPWTAPPSYTHPAAWTKIAVYTKVRLQTYNSKSSTLASWFPHHKIFMAGDHRSTARRAGRADRLDQRRRVVQGLARAGRRERPRAASAGLSGRPPQWSGQWHHRATIFPASRRAIPAVN